MRIRDRGGDGVGEECAPTRDLVRRAEAAMTIAESASGGADGRTP